MAANPTFQDMETEEAEKVLADCFGVTASRTLANVVAESSEQHWHYIAKLKENYEQKVQWRKRRGWRVPACCGHGRAGKDFAAAFLCHIAGVDYPGSTSRIVLPIIADSFHAPEPVVWESRHQHRLAWYLWCNEFRRQDPTRLCCMSLGRGDVVSGIRDFHELLAVRDQEVIATSFWVDNPRVPVDPTVTYGPEDCDFTVLNSGSRSEFARKLRRLVALLNPSAA